MRKDYKSLTTLSLKQRKEYLLKIHYCEEVFHCMSEKELNHYLCDTKVKKIFYINALRALYNSSHYNELEYHIMMMNDIFHEQGYEDIKRQLLKKLSKKAITIDEYCVIRHLIDFQNISFQSWIQYLHQEYNVDEEECARICLLEDQHQLAYQYLKKLNDCNDQHLLDLLCSYSYLEYASLIKHYHKSSKPYSLATTH